MGSDEDIPIPREPTSALHLIETLLRRQPTPDFGNRVPRFALYIGYAETLIPPQYRHSSISQEDRTILQHC